MIYLGEIDNETCYDTKEAAESLGVSAGSIARAIRDKRIQAVKIGRKYQIIGKELKRFAGAVQDRQEE